MCVVKRGSVKLENKIKNKSKHAGKILCNIYAMVCLSIRGHNPLLYTTYISVDLTHNEIFIA